MSQAFVEEQNKLTMPYLEQCAIRAQFHQRLTALYDYPKYSCPYKRGKRYYLKFKEQTCTTQTGKQLLLWQWLTLTAGQKLQTYLKWLYFLFLFSDISTFTTKASRTRMCYMCRTLWMELPLSSLTQINFLKMALWHCRVSQTAEQCADTHIYR